MTPTKSDSCTCVNCKCDPCECREGAYCGKSAKCSSSWCNWGAALRIAIAVALIIGAFCLGASLGSHGGRWDRDDDRDGYSRRGGMMQGQMGNKMDPMAEHCKTMPGMMGCKKYQTGMNMSRNMMSMSMDDMGAMLAGKTGDALDRAFLEGMIPHHQAAVDMARYMSGSTHTELIKLAKDIIASQSREIEQMKQWQIAWGYTATGTTNTGMMMNQGMSSGTMNR